MQCECAQENNECGRAGDDSAGDSEGKELSEADGLRCRGRTLELDLLSPCRLHAALPEFPVSMG